jgi:signal transduction histidine kinase
MSTTGDEGAALQAVSSAVLAVTRHLSVREVLQVIVRAAGQLLDARYAALGIPDEDGAFAEFITEGISEDERERIGPMPRQHGMLAVMLKDEQVHRHDDIRKQPGFWGWPAEHPVLKDFLGVPIKDGDVLLGILFLANRPGGFEEHHAELLELFAAHAAIAITNARLYERHREFTVVEERNRLARELHDAVCQRLFSLRLIAQAGAPDALEQVDVLAAEALAELRAVIFALRPARLEDEGLAETLRKHVEVLDRVYPAGVTLEVLGSPEPADVVYRIAQEALSNALRHSGARNVAVRITDHSLEVTDDGHGVVGENTGLGLASMRERAASAGGTLTVESGAGTTVRLVLP